CGGAAGAERQVVFARAALVAIAFNENAHVLVAAQPCGLALKNGARFWRQIEAVIAEEDAITDRDAELFRGTRDRTRRRLLLRWRRRSGRRRRCWAAGARGECCNG